MSLLLLGATGASGSRALLAALSEPLITSIHSFGRSTPTLPPTGDSSKFQHTSFDFEQLLEQGTEGSEAKKLREVKADTVLITLGTTRFNAGTAAAFERADREYVIAAAKAARVEGEKQRLIYLSVRLSALPLRPFSLIIHAHRALPLHQSGGANSSLPFLYLKSKGLTEEALAALDYTETVFFKPAYLAVEGGREGKRKIFESFFGCVLVSLPSSSFHPADSVPLATASSPPLSPSSPTTSRSRPSLSVAPSSRRSSLPRRRISARRCCTRT